MACIHDLREVLLSGTSNPDLISTSLGKLCDDLLKIEVSVPFAVDELAHLIGKHDKTVVFSLVLEERRELGCKAVDAHVGVTTDDPLSDALLVEGRGELYGDVKNPVKLLVDDVSSYARIVPVGISLLKDPLLERLEYALLRERLLKVLRKSDIELVESSLAVELVPEHVKERLLLVCGVVV